MRLHRITQLTCLLFAGGVSAVYPATVYNEAISGDLSNSGLNPTAITLGLGSNQVFGTTGRVTATDLDYFSITVAPGFQLNALTVLPGTTAGGVSFIGLQAGSQVTLPTNASSAAGLLGWRHYGPADINTNILPAMAVPAQGSSGFSVPLPAGNYSFWIQDSSPGTFNYGFDLIVSQVPEPATCAAALAGLGLISILRRRRLL
jgi:hypothetical protein